MEAVYAENLTPEHSIIELSAAEAKHCRVRRMKDSDTVIVLNGKGLASLGVLRIDDKNDTISVQCKQFKEKYGESSYDTTIMMGWLDNKERLEFAIEKCTELGIKRFILTRTQFSSQKKPDALRLQEKIIATIKQCKRALLPQIIIKNNVKEALSLLHDVHIFIADAKGTPLSSPTDNTCFCIGPEGGFSTEELELLQKNNGGATFVSLGTTRLRAETAAIAASVLLQIR